MYLCADEKHMEKINKVQAKLALSQNKGKFRHGQKEDGNCILASVCSKIVNFQNYLYLCYNMCYNKFEVKTMNFPEFVKMARQKTGMSQEDLARALNVSFATINRWENGKTHPNKLTQAVFFDFCQKRGLEIAYSKGKEE